MSERQGIEIDYCPKCRGVWLDRGELDKLIERSAAFERGTGEPSAPGSFSGGGTEHAAGVFLPPQPYPDRDNHGPWAGDRHRGRDDHQDRRRGSFLSGLFD